MSRKLDDFISKIKTTGVAHPHLFTVTIHPSGVNGKTSNGHVLNEWSSADTNDIFLMCNSAQLPENSIMTTPMKTYGISPEMPYEKQSGSISLSFYVLADFDVLKFFNHWSKAVYNPDTGYFGFKDDYVATISIVMESPELVKEYELACYECYPKSVGAISLSSQHEAAPMILTVEFVYTSKKEIKINGH